MSDFEHQVITAILMVGLSIGWVHNSFTVIVIFGLTLFLLASEVLS